VTCPYSDPDCTSDIAANAPRCLCGRYQKRCPGCATRNRAFANFCRDCGKALPPLKTNWSGYRGGPRRLGVNTASPGSACLVAKTDLVLQLGDTCRSLLGYDGHLLAISLGGVVEMADPLRAKSVCRFAAQGPITAEPCIRNGVLYLATRGQLSAYPLAAMTMATPRVRPLWQLPVNGTPIQALTAIGDRLYVTLASANWREVHVVDGLDQRQQPVARSLHGASKISWLAADPATARAVFLSEIDGRGVQLHVSGSALASHPVALHGLAEHPIALLAGSVFGIFGDAHQLYRIDASSGAVEEPLDEDTQLFAVTHDVDDEWDRDSVLIDTGGITFSRAGVRDTFEPHERAVKGSPIVVRGCAAVIGMEDGRVRIYDLTQLPRQDVWYVGGSRNSAEITALASFDSYIAAGNRDGVVEVCELRARGTGR
jgi:hypothetical protein